MIIVHQNTYQILMVFSLYGQLRYDLSWNAAVGPWNIAMPLLGDTLVWNVGRGPWNAAVPLLGHTCHTLILALKFFPINHSFRFLLMTISSGHDAIHRFVLTYHHLLFHKPLGVVVWLGIGWLFSFGQAGYGTHYHLIKSGGISWLNSIHVLSPS